MSTSGRLRLDGAVWTPLLLIAGGMALALAFLGARPYSWSQFCLLVAGAVCLVLSPGVLRRRFSSLVHDREAYEATVLALRRQPATRIMHAVWLGCIIALLEIGLKTFEDAAGKRVLGLQYLWDVPIGYLLPLVGLGAVTALLAKRLPALRALRVIVFFSVFIALAGWTPVLVRGLHWSAAIILAAGLAGQLARLAGRFPQVVHVPARRSVIWLATAVAVIAMGAIAWPRLSEVRATRALSPPPQGAPNVLLIVLDTVRAGNLGLYGYERATSPHLDQFAQRGVVFSHAFSTSPWTLPSHGGMFTGRLPHELGGGWMTPIGGTYPTVAEALTSRGYATAGFIANTAYCAAEFGLARGFTHYEDHRPSVVRSLLATSFGTAVSKALSLPSRYRFWLKNAEQVNAEFLRWADARDTERPFFAFLNYYDAHAPYIAPPEYVRRFSSAPVRGDIWSKKLDAWKPDDIREFKTAYDAAVSYLDDQVGRLFEAMTQRNLLGNTIVIITADHGEQFGEHGLLEHANSLYLPLLHVPLIVVAPNQVPAAGRVESFASLRDLPQTIFELTGQQTGRFPGASLARHWTMPGGAVAGAATPLVAEVDPAYDAYPNSYPARQGVMRSLFAGTRHYIHNEGSGKEELYELSTDFQEQHDLSAIELTQMRDFRAMLQKAVSGGR
jgi:arylsulfatase A-like enzyme